MKQSFTLSDFINGVIKEWNTRQQLLMLSITCKFLAICIILISLAQLKGINASNLFENLIVIRVIGCWLIFSILLFLYGKREWNKFRISH